MKHASAAALAELGGLLVSVRSLPGLTERRPGVFYLRGKACLHFHEDPEGLFADLRLQGPDFERQEVGSQEGRVTLLSRLREALTPHA